MINKYRQYTTEIESTKYLSLINQASDRLEEFSNRLLHGSNFTIVKFGDGELRNMISNNEHEHNCDGNMYFRGLGDDLIASYIYFLKNESSYICKWHSHEYTIQHKMEEDHKSSFNDLRKFVYYDLLIHKMPISIEQLKFFKILKHIKRNKIYISNSDMIDKLSNVLNLTHGFVIPKQNAYLFKGTIFTGLKNLFQNINSPSIVMLSAGMFSKVIIAFLSENFPDNTYLDIGSSFD